MLERARPLAVALPLIAGCATEVAEKPPAGMPAVAAPVVVSASLEADPAARACLGPPEGYADREELEPHVAVNPRDPDHLVAAWMARVRGEVGAVLAARSRDGGRTWDRVAVLPFNACAGGGPGLPAVSDPWVAIGPEGLVYVGAIGWKPGEWLDSASVVTVVTSSDGGESWGDPVAASTARFPEFMHDNVALAADVSVPGRVWIATTRLGADGSPAATVRTSDGGRTWSGLRPAIPEGRAASAPQPVAYGDEVHLFYGHGPDGSRVSTVRSGDGGDVWSAPRLVHEGAPVDGPIVFPGTAVELSVAPDIMHPAVDPETGDLYVTFTTADPHDPGRPAVWLTASRDGGAAWAPPIRVGGDGQAAWRPTLAVGAGGPAAVTYFGASAGQAVGEDEALSTDVWLRTFRWNDGEGLAGGDPVLLDRFAWEPRRIGEYFLGDYHGLVATPGAAVAVYARSAERGSRVVAVRRALP